MRYRLRREVVWRIPRWFDIPLRGLKYLLLGLFLYAVGTMSAAAIAAFLESPFTVATNCDSLEVPVSLAAHHRCHQIALVERPAQRDSQFCKDGNRPA